MLISPVIVGVTLEEAKQLTADLNPIDSTLHLTAESSAAKSRLDDLSKLMLVVSAGDIIFSGLGSIEPF